MCALAAMGALIAFGAMYFVAKTRTKPASVVTAIISGGMSSSTLGAVGTTLAGMHLSISWVEAATVSLLSFCVSFVFWGLGALWMFNRQVLVPISNRFGAHVRARLWIELWVGVESFRTWLARVVHLADGDKVWDEFAASLPSVIRDLDGTPGGAEITAGVIAALRGGNSAPQSESAVKLLGKALSPGINTLVSRLSETTLNFSIWRVSRSGTDVEHLLSLPVEPADGSGHRQKETLPIWVDLARSRPGSVAGDALICRSFTAHTASDFPEGWPVRRLGRIYDACAAMPIPCEGFGDGAQAPWGVVCVESRAGGLPLKSDSVQLLMSHIAAAVARAAPNLRLAVVDQVKQQEAHNGPDADHGRVTSTAR